MTTRPRRLINEHKAEWEENVTAHLARAGWAQKEVTVKKWSHQA